MGLWSVLCECPAGRVWFWTEDAFLFDRIPLPLVTGLWDQNTRPRLRVGIALGMVCSIMMRSKISPNASRGGNLRGSVVDKEPVIEID